MQQFVIIKAFFVQVHAPNAPCIKVLWQPPFFNLIKYNIDGSTKGCPGPAACGEIFKDNNVNFLGGFVVILHITIAFQTELHGLMNAIDIDSN
jgi:hypothetical protein